MVRIVAGVLVVAACGRFNFEAPRAAVDASIDGSSTAFCSDGVPSGSEVCDDGNLIDGDGCSANCKSNESCSNGTLDVVAGETCDDGNLVSGDGCSMTCQSSEACGNGSLDNGEACDTLVNTMTCDRDCTAPMCPDGLRNAAANEECDDGNVTNTDSCTAGCVAARCNDGFIWAGVEQCEDGNTDNNDACAFCRNARCGDGLLWSGMEQCDDGNTANTDACVSCQAALCGDGFVRTAVETCDDGANNGMVGFCNLACSGPT